MGNCCIKSNDKKEYDDNLIRYIYCDQCNREYISYYEYNRHIYECNKKFNIKS